MCKVGLIVGYKIEKQQDVIHPIWKIIELYIKTIKSLYSTPLVPASYSVDLSSYKISAKIFFNYRLRKSFKIFGYFFG